MADQSDAEIALATLVATALYPEGPDGPSVPGPPCRVYRGWPNPAALDADLAQGRINVTVFAGNAPPRPTNRFAAEWHSVPEIPGLQVSVSNNSVSFTGRADPGQLIGVRVDGQPYTYRTQANDTPALVAATIAAQIRVSRIAHLRGSSFDIPGAHDLLARIVIDTAAIQEIRRQRLAIRVTCWCPSPALRDTTAAAIDLAFALTPFIFLADSSHARLTFTGGAILDQSESASLYRRDLLYDIEYATTLTQTLPAMLFGALGLNASHITA